MKWVLAYLWSCIAWGATGRFKSLILLVHVRKTKIDYLKRIVVIEEQIFRFQVTMAHATLVQILDSSN